MIAELDVPSSGGARVHRAYAWGLDASGTLTGAGGVGGLLLTSHHTPQAGGGTQVTTLAPLYDFNGNVLAYADVATSTITHRMEYDPFGQELSLDTLLPGESAVEAPRFRFSSKYTDGETGLVYYGFRYYAPEQGRWRNRDPIEERGGINLYGMVENDAVNGWDFLGACPNSNCGQYEGGPQEAELKKIAREVRTGLASGTIQRNGSKSCTLDHAYLIAAINARSDSFPCWTCQMVSRSLLSPEDQALENPPTPWIWQSEWWTMLDNGGFNNHCVVQCNPTQVAPPGSSFVIKGFILDITGTYEEISDFEKDFPYEY